MARLQTRYARIWQASALVLLLLIFWLDTARPGSDAIPVLYVIPTILFVGDVVGGLGRRTLLGLLPGLRERLQPDFVVVNGENSAGGLGITPKIADEMFAAGVDVITLGNHTYQRREIAPYLDSHDRILRPANFLASQPGHGWCIVERGGVRLAVINLQGNVFLRSGRVAFVARRPLVAANRLVGDLALVAAADQQAPGTVAFAVVARRRHALL